jgi:hypothetical protein
MDEKAGMSPNPQLQAAKRIAELGAPRTARLRRRHPLAFGSVIHGY